MMLFEIIIGTLTFLFFVSAALLTAVMRRYVDPEKVKAHSDIQGLFSNGLLPKDVLTPGGQRLWLIRNICFIGAMVCVAAIVVQQQII